MKFHQVFLIMFLFLSCSSIEGVPERKYYFIEDNVLVSKVVFNSLWRSEEGKLARWDYIKKDSGRVARLNVPKYETGKISYSKLILHLENLTNKKFKNAPAFLIEYNYLNDLCSSNNPDNEVSKSNIRKEKAFQRPVIKDIQEEYEKIVCLVFFQKEIVLENNPNSPEEYFFSDSRNFLGKTIFKHPTFCGSYALIVPNGKFIVRNGESRMDYFLNEILKSRDWNRFLEE